MALLWNWRFSCQRFGLKIRRAANCASQLRLAAFMIAGVNP
jgi:hypothetical protein